MRRGCTPSLVEGREPLWTDGPTAAVAPRARLTEGARDLASLEEYVTGDLTKPVCSVGNEGACDDDEVALLSEYGSMGEADLAARMSALGAESNKATEDLEVLIQELTEQYEKGMESMKTIKAAVKKKMKILKPFLAAADEGEGGSEL